MAYEVSTPVFAGPFDLLLHLILRDEVDLYALSLSAIVDAYLAELAKLEIFDLELATEFLLIAATLIELKARRLLPGRDDIDLDDELALWEERDLLLARLVECKTFKDVAVVLAEFIAQAAQTYPRLVGPDERFSELAPDPLLGMNPKRLRDAFVRAITPKVVPTVDLYHVNPIRLTVAEAVDELTAELSRAGRLSFRRMTDGMTERLEIIVRFLALLEMFKQGTIDIEQAEMFADIEVLWIGDQREAVSYGVSVDDYEG